MCEGSALPCNLHSAPAARSHATPARSRAIASPPPGCRKELLASGPLRPVSVSIAKARKIISVKHYFYTLEVRSKIIILREILSLSDLDCFG